MSLWRRRLDPVKTGNSLSRRRFESNSMNSKSRRKRSWGALKKSNSSSK